MEIFWLCEHCDSTNNYVETKVCEVCGEKIDPKSEEKCIYEMAEQLCEKAVTSSDYFTACEYYLKVLNYKDARQKHSECQFKAEKTVLNEKIYQEAKEYFKTATELATAEKWDDAVEAFSAAEQQFKKIAGFLDSKRSAEHCQHEIELCQSKRIYFEAKKILATATSIEHYKAAADLFYKVSKFSDAKENYDICVKFIEQLAAKKQLEQIKEYRICAESESDLDKKTEILQKIVSLENAALSDEAKRIILQSKPLLEDCLKQKKAIETRKALEIAMVKYNDALKTDDHQARILALEKILSDYKEYGASTEFTQLFKSCNDNITFSQKQVDYNSAIAMMQSADTIDSLKNAAEAFSRLSDFNDSEKKRKECLEKADYLANEITYKTAMETHEKGRKISIFNWKKHI